MAPILLSLLAGLLFGAGLTLSQMVDPGKVVAFLDFGGMASGTWDPSLAFVMLGAVAVTAVGYRLVVQRGQPLWAERFQIPTRRAIDARLISGSALFGLGWGIVGFCPGPAIAALLLDGVPVAVFLAAMAAGMFGFSLLGEGKGREVPRAG